MKQELEDGAVVLAHSEHEFVEPIQSPATQDYFVKPSWWDSTYENGITTGQHRDVVRSFLTGTLTRRTKVSPGNGRHVYFTKNQGKELWLFKDNPALKINVMIAKQTPRGVFVGNSSSLTAIRQAPNKHGKRPLNWTMSGESRMQSALSDVMPMIPFRTLKEARLDLDSLSIVDKGPSERIDRGEKNKQKESILSHFTGAMLFKIDVRARSRGLLLRSEEDIAQYYLFDIDRNDLAMKNFNPFLSKLRRQCTSIQDAYDSMKPKEVLEVERFTKAPCPRQGEWFFIPVFGRHEKSGRTPVSEWYSGPKVQAVLSAHGNRPHYVEELSVDGFVRGTVYHGGREHLPIMLKGWHKPVPNDTVESFKISGAID